MNYYGDFAEDDTVDIIFNTFDSNDPSESVTIGAFVNTDVHIHKDLGLTQRNNAAGITVSVDFDGITGNHAVKIDTSDNTVGGFYVTGSEYQVRIEGTTVDGGTVNAWIGSFSIERAGGVLALLKTINIANGAVEADLTYIHGTALTETAGQLAAAFKKLFDVATPLLVASDVMVGTDGANTTVPDAAGVAATPAEVATALTDIKLDHLIHIAAAEDEVADNSVIARLAATEGDWSEFNDENHSLEAIRVRGDAAWIAATGFGTAVELAKVPKSDSNVVFNATALASIKTAMEADAGDLSSLMEALVNKQRIKHTGADVGDVEVFNDAGVSQGEVDQAYSEDAVWKIRQRIFK